VAAISSQRILRAFFDESTLSTLTCGNVPKHPMEEALWSTTQYIRAMTIPSIVMPSSWKSVRLVTLDPGDLTPDAAITVPATGLRP
jgi:hypothetical protein